MESVEQLQPQRQVCPNSTLKAPYGGRSRAATEDNVVLPNFADARPHRVAQAGCRDVSPMYQSGEHRDVSACPDSICMCAHRPS